MVTFTIVDDGERLQATAICELFSRLESERLSVLLGYQVCIYYDIYIYNYIYILLFLSFVFVCCRLLLVVVRLVKSALQFLLLEVEVLKLGSL